MIRNWQLKLSSLCVAIFLALVVNYFFTPAEYGTSVVQLIAPVEVQNVPENKYVLWPETRQVELTVQGSSLFISKVALSSPVVKIAMPDGAINSFKTKISRENINLPFSVKLLGVKPAELEFGVDDIIEKTLPVVVPQIGKLQNDLKLEKISVTPKEVIVRGPSQELKSINSIETSPINMAALNATSELDLELRTVWSLLPGKERSVKVLIELTEALGEMSFSNVPVEYEIRSEEAVKYNPRLSTKVVTIIAKGSKKELRKLKKEDLKVKAVFSNIEQIKDSIELEVMPIEFLELVVTPKKLGLLVDPTPTATPNTKKTNKKSVKN